MAMCTGEEQEGLLCGRRVSRARQPLDIKALKKRVEGKSCLCRAKFSL